MIPVFLVLSMVVCVIGLGAYYARQDALRYQAITLEGISEKLSGDLVGDFFTALRLVGLDAGEDGNLADWNAGIVSRGDPGYVVALLPEIPRTLLQHLSGRSDIFLQRSIATDDVLLVDFEPLGDDPKKDFVKKALRVWSEKHHVIVRYINV